MLVEIALLMAFSSLRSMSGKSTGIFRKSAHKYATYGIGDRGVIRIIEIHKTELIDK